VRVTTGAVRSLVVPAAGLGIWALLEALGLLQHRAVAGPGAVGAALWKGVVQGTLWPDLAATLGRVMVAVVVALGPATAAGLWMGSSPRHTQLWEPTVEFWRAVPPLLVLPVFVLAFGYGEATRVGVAGWAAGWLVTIHVAAGVRRLHPQRDRYLRSLRAGWWQRLRWQWAYELLPQALLALRQAVGTALVVTVVTEMMLGASHGLGACAMRAQLTYDTPQLYAVILLTGAVGFLVAKAILALEHRLLRWDTG